MAAFAFLAAINLQAQTYYTNATPGDWSVSGNWTGVNSQPSSSGSTATAIVFTNATANNLAYTNDLSSGGPFTLNQLVNAGTNLLLYGTSGSSLSFASDGAVLPAIAGAPNGGLSIYEPITLGANLTVNGGGAGTYLYGNITQSGTAALTLQGSGATFLYGTNGYSGGTTNSGSGVLYVNNSASLGSGPLFLNANTWFESYSSITLLSPVIGVASGGTFRLEALTNAVSPNTTVIINTYSNLTPIVGGTLTNTLDAYGPGTVIITNADYCGQFNVGTATGSGGSGGFVYVTGNFTNTLITSITTNGNLNVSGSMAQIGAGSGSGFTVNGTMNLSTAGTLFNNWSFSDYGIANMAGTWTNGGAAVIAYTNGVLNMSGTLNAGFGMTVRAGGTINISGTVNSFSSINVPATDFNPAGYTRGATFFIASNGVVNNENNFLILCSNGVVEVAGLLNGFRLDNSGGLLQLSDGTNAGTAIMTSSVNGAAPGAGALTTNTYIIGGSPNMSVLMTSNHNITIPANVIVGSASQYANNVILYQAGTAGSLTVNGANTYSGGTVVEDGNGFTDLAVYNSNGLGTGPLTVGTTNTANGAYVCLNNHSITVSGLSGGCGADGSGGGTFGQAPLCAIYNGNTSANNVVTLTINQTNNSTYYGVIMDATTGATNMNIPAGVMSVVKMGPGTLTLAGQDLYSGSTTAAGGTLAIEQATLAANSVIMVTNGGILKLDFNSVNPVSKLLLNGVSQPAGIYGSGNAPGFLTGTGQLQVSTPSSNANLLSLALNPAGTLSPAFASSTLVYWTTNAVGAYPRIMVTNADLTATNVLIYNGATNLLASGVASAPLTLVAGATNVVTVQVTAQDGLTVQTYTVNVVSQSASASANAALLSLALNPAGTLSPAFASNVLSYATTETYSTNFRVTVVDMDLTATNQLTYNGVNYGGLLSGVASGSLALNPNPGYTNKLSVLVTAQNGTTTNLYTVNVVQLPSQTRPTLTNHVNGMTLTLAWPLGNLGYRLLEQTNNLNQGVSGNINDWALVVGSTATNKAIIQMSSTNLNEYYQLVYP